MLKLTRGIIFLSKTDSDLLVLSHNELNSIIFLSWANVIIQCLRILIGMPFTQKIIIVRETSWEKLLFATDYKF